MPDPTEAPPAPVAVDHSTVFARAREMVATKHEIDRLTVLLDAQKEIRDKAEAYLLEAFANEPGLGGIKVDGYTVFTKRTLYANSPDKEAAHKALIAAGLEGFATTGFNAQSVSSLFREWDKNGEEPPAELAGVFTVSETYKIGLTKSA